MSLAFCPNPNNFPSLKARKIISKLIERVVFNQLYEYLNNNNLLTESESDFRPMFSTETALLEATNEWLWNVDNNLLLIKWCDISGLEKNP